MWRWTWASSFLHQDGRVKPGRSGLPTRWPQLVRRGPGTIVNTATVTGATGDPDPADNTATTETTVLAAAPDGDGDPYDTYDDDPGEPGFDFDSPFGDAGDPAAPETDSPVDVAVAGVLASDSPQGGGPAGGQPDVAGEQLSDSDNQDGGPALFGELPRTGGSVVDLILAGAAILALGAATVLAGRKRRATA